MAHEGKSPDSAALPVRRSKEEARHLYDRVSRFYDYLAGPFERKYAEMALEQLSIKNGETVLEIGFGTGYCLKRMAQSAGSKGKAYGIDISPSMVKVTKKRLEKARLLDRVALYCGDAMKLPYGDNTFDAAFMSFTLELFDTPEIPKVLEEIKRVLKPDGRLGVVSMSRSYGEPAVLRLYEWIHKKWPKYVDCRPIYVEESLREARYNIQSREKVGLFGLPGEIVIATKTISNSSMPNCG
jgi:demethylmenaquinone methyltransferase/2-methoxy-6-polyprenyl-1,4-benzoquinol methylase